MGKQKRIHKSFQSLCNNITEHIQKYQKAYNQGDNNLCGYYIKEIEQKFFKNIEKLRIDYISDQEYQTLLSLKQQRDETKTLPWNDTTRST